MVLVSPLVGMNKNIITISDQETLNKLVLEKFTPIVAKYYERMSKVGKQINTDDGSSSLSHGYWYRNDYLEILDLYVKKGSKWAKKQMVLFSDEKLVPRGYIASPYFKRKGLGYAYHLRKNAEPSQALKSLEEFLVFIDCSIAYQLAYYLAVLEFLGTEKFNRYFLNFDTKKPFFSLDTTKTKLFNLLETVSIDITENQLGSFFYLKNHPFYVWKNPHGYGQGYNLLHSGTNEHGEKLYIGFGLPAEGLSVEGIKEILVEDFNRNCVTRPSRGKIMGHFPKTELRYSLWLFWQDKQINSVDDETFFPELEDYFTTLFSNKKKARRHYEKLKVQATTRNSFVKGLQLGLTILQEIESDLKVSH